MDTQAVKNCNRHSDRVSPMTPARISGGLNGIYTRIIIHRSKPGLRQSLRIIIFSLYIIPFLAMPALAQKANPAIKQKKEAAAKSEAQTGVKFRPEIGAMGSYIIPLGKPSPRLGQGYGASLYVDIEPYTRGLFSLRTGISSAFMYFSHSSSNVTAKLMVFPQCAYLKFSIQTAGGFLAYAKIGGGVSIALLDKKTYGIIGTKRSAYDITAVGGLGIGFNPPKVANLVVFVEGDYYALFEKTMGHFLAASIGTAYRF